MKPKSIRCAFWSSRWLAGRRLNNFASEKLGHGRSCQFEAASAPPCPQGVTRHYIFVDFTTSTTSAMGAVTFSAFGHRIYKVPNRRLSVKCRCNVKIPEDLLLKDGRQAIA